MNIQKHLPGRHDQQKHAGDVESLLAVINDIPVNPLLGPAKLKQQSYTRVQDVSNSVPNLIVFDKPFAHLNVLPDGIWAALAPKEGYNDVLDALIDYGRALCKKVGNAQLRVILTSPEQLAVITKHDYEIDFDHVKEALDDSSVYNNEIMKKEFSDACIATVTKKLPKADVSRVIAKVNDYIDEDAQITGRRRPSTLNPYSTFKLQRILAEETGWGIHVYADAK